MEKKKWTVFRIATLAVLGAAAILLTLSPALAWEEVHGRMTGGGSVICNSNPCIESEGGTDPTGRVTHGFEVHCTPSDGPNNLEINDHIGSNRFHLDSVDTVFCYTEEGIDPKPPVAGFNTYLGYGTGSWNGTPGASIIFKLLDAGEPGTNDTMCVYISVGSTIVLQVGTFAQINSVTTHCPVPLTFGNQQAHKDN